MKFLEKIKRFLFGDLSPTTENFKAENNISRIDLSHIEINRDLSEEEIIKMSNKLIKQRNSIIEEYERSSYLEKTNNIDMTMDTILNCYLYCKEQVPSIITEILRDNELHRTVGYAFVAGLLGKDYNPDENKDNEKNSMEG